MGNTSAGHHDAAVRLVEPVPEGIGHRIEVRDVHGDVLEVRTPDAVQRADLHVVGPIAVRIVRVLVVGGRTEGQDARSRVDLETSGVGAARPVL